MEAFYKIISQENKEEKVVFKIRLNNKHSIYEGHFPDMPIVPGVLLIQISKELLELVLNQKLSLTESRSIKFLDMIIPSQDKELIIELEIEKSEVIKSKIIINSKEKTCFKMSGHYISSSSSNGSSSSNF